MFAARQIANNLSPLAIKFWVCFGLSLILRIISFERTFNYSTCVLQFFLCLFCARFALLKTGLSNQKLAEKGLKIESFLPKTLKLLWELCYNQHCLYYSLYLIFLSQLCVIMYCAYYQEASQLWKLWGYKSEVKLRPGPFLSRGLWISMGGR